MNSSAEKFPLVSAIIPCRNEETYIEECLISLVRQKRSNFNIEILVVDGMSTDNTRTIVEKVAKEYPYVKLLDNPKLITPSAMNIGIRESTGKFIAILGAHTKYSEDYLAKCLSLIDEHPDASCVGGPIFSYAHSPFGKATALAMSSKIGVGNANHRFSDYEGYAEGACFPVFKNDVFSKVGFYDENFIKNQDDEFNFRLRKHNLKIFISNKVQSLYYVRETPGKLFKQYFDYGHWRVAVIKKHRMPSSFRQIVPISFFFLMLLLVLISPILPLNWLITSFTLPVIYFFSLFFVGFKLAAINGFTIVVYFPLAVFIMHLAYALGFLKGFLKFYVR